MEDRRRYLWLKLLTILGPTLFVTGAESFRLAYLRHHFSPPVVSAIAVATTLVAAVIFSWYVFRAVERVETERREYKEALLSLKERERIAREMHDGVAQNLAVLKLETYKLKGMAETGDVPLAGELDVIDKLINQTYLEVRQTLYDLRVSHRLEEGFWPTVEQQVSEFQRQTGVQVGLTLPDPPEEPWSQLASVQILRIIQEALTNVRKHSAARRVDIACARRGHLMELTIRDDGCGFSTSPDGTPSGHYGLQVMLERAETIGGRLRVESEPGEGTTVVLSIPVEGR